MNKIIVTFLLLSLATAQVQKKYYKGNTHTHCYPESGDITNTAYTGAAVVSQYQALGYDFLVFTDHGAWWNAAPLSTSSFTVINGSEAGISGNGRWGHFTGLRMTNRISGAGRTHHSLIDSIQKQKAVCFLNHPRWSVIPITAQQMIDSMPTLTHVEVFNAVTTNQTGSYDNLSLWDSVLSTGRQLFGVASDDSHQSSHQGKGWIMVYASSNHRDSLTEAIRRGDFYASNGIILDTIAYTTTTIYVKSTNGDTTKFFGKNGKLIETKIGKEASYVYKGDELYIRAIIINTSGKSAWVQPYFPQPTTGILNESRKNFSEIVRDVIVRQNYPNPANPSTIISYSLLRSGTVQIRIYDTAGRIIATPFERFQEEGIYNLTVDLSEYSSGIYFYCINFDGAKEFRKMIVLR